jgi:pyridoxine 5-phosphate synthase
VAHLSEDRRHIEDRDIQRLKNILKIPLAMEMAATEEMIRIACRVRPSRVCLVPEKRQELTTEGGLRLQQEGSKISKFVRLLRKKGIQVSLFVDPDPATIVLSKAAAADMVELHTGAYARAKGAAREKELQRLRRSGAVATQMGIRLHAGHGLNYENVRAVAKIPGMEELNIGFSIISHAVFIGLGPAVREMKERICAG